MKQEQYEITVLYKNGEKMSFWCSDFKVSGGVRYSWTSVDARMCPIVIGVDEVAAIWQTNIRHANV